MSHVFCYYPNSPEMLVAFLVFYWCHIYLNTSQNDSISSFAVVIFSVTLRAGVTLPILSLPLFYFLQLKTSLVSLIPRDSVFLKFVRSG